MVRAPADKLVPLTLAVLAAHAVVLYGWKTDTLAVRGLPTAASFVTRQVAPTLSPAQAAAAPKAPPEPRARGTAQSSAARPTQAAPEPPAAETTAPASPAGARLLDPNAPAPEPSQGERWRATALPEPARMHYEVVVEARGTRVQGKAQLDWRHNGTDYDARLELALPFLPSRAQRSSGRITADGLEPRRFSDEGRRGEEAAHFVPEQGKIVFSNNRPEAALVAGTQDRLSVVIQLSVIIGGDPAHYPAGASLAIPTAGVRDADTWVFTVEGEELLVLPGGVVRALKLERAPRKEFDQRLELWLDTSKDYAPVRLRLTNPNGDSVDQRWSSTDKG